MCDVGISIQHINTFPRTEVIAMLRAKQTQHNVSLDIVERYRFGGSAAELNEYIEHLQRNTYIICPRGSENYSFQDLRDTEHGSNSCHNRHRRRFAEAGFLGGTLRICALRFLGSDL